MTPDEFMDFTRPLPDRPYDEQYDSQSDVERDPCGAWVAIQHMAHHLDAAPQPAPAPADERAAMIEVIVQADDAYDRVQGGSWAGAIADALLAAGWTRGGDAAGLREAARELCDRLDEFSIRDGDFEGMVRDYLKNVADAHIALGAALARLSAPETLAWAVVGKDGKIDPRKLWINSRDAEEYCERGERAVRVAIRVVEGGDDAA